MNSGSFEQTTSSWLIEKTGGLNKLEIYAYRAKVSQGCIPVLFWLREESLVPGCREGNSVGTLVRLVVRRSGRLVQPKQQCTRRLVILMSASNRRYCISFASVSRRSSSKRDVTRRFDSSPFLLSGRAEASCWLFSIGIISRLKSKLAWSRSMSFSP